MCASVLVVSLGGDGWGKRKGKTCSSAVDLEDDF